MTDSRIEKGFLKSGDLEKINAFSTRALDESELYIFNATLCDNDIDRDFEKFSISALKALAPLFIGKTVIADHSMRSADQKARIFDTFVEEQKGRKTADGEALYALKGRAYMLRSEANEDFIRELEAGIKKEGSVSCAMGKQVCSICGQDRRTQKCEHINAKRYGGKLCFTILEEPLDAYEFSFVAVPAQRDAGVTKAFGRKEEINMEHILKSIEACDERGITLSKAQADALCDYLVRLEDEARLGGEYKKQLSKEVLKLFSLRFPEIDSKLFASITAVMTAKELIGFKTGLEQSGKTNAPQIMPKSGKQDKMDFSQFKI